MPESSGGIKKRLVRSARVQEGEQPPEEMTELLSEVERVFTRLLELVSAINRTNSATLFEGERTIADAMPNGMWSASAGIFSPAS